MRELKTLSMKKEVKRIFIYQKPKIKKYRNQESGIEVGYCEVHEMTD